MASVIGRYGAAVRRRLRRWTPSWRWLFGVLRLFLTSAAALAVSLWLLPGEQVGADAETVLLVAASVLAIGALLRPFLTQLVVFTGPVGLLVAGLLVDAAILGAALAVVPGVAPFSFSELVLAAWGAVAVAAVLNWLFDSSTDEAFFSQVLGRAIRIARRESASGPGLLVIQLDGVGADTLRQAVTAGSSPTIGRWLRSGDYRFRTWHTGVPATTPAGQAVLLHGDAHEVPAFRWYDKAAGRSFVSSRPEDVAVVQERISTGRGLLADDGVSVSNQYSGDAPTSLLTMSSAGIPRDRGLAAFMTTSAGFARSVVLMVGQMITEIYQGRRQRRRAVVPRVRRSGNFVLLRGLTTVVLRDLNVQLVSEHMARGAPVIFVDFVDFDEVAHHAGPARPESLKAMEGLDRVIGFLAEVADEVGRDYEIAIVSDHGQSQGPTFRQLSGATLAEVVDLLAALPARRAHHDDEPAELWGPANMLSESAPGTGRLIGAAARTVAVGSGGSGSPRGGGVDENRPLVVMASGSLAHLYLRDVEGTASREAVDARYPLLVQGLAQHPHIGLVVTHVDGGLRVDGATGWRLLRPGSGSVLDGSGIDPLLDYGPFAEDDVRDVATRAHAGDLVVMGRYDADLDEVVAFEELVGSHGGMGGGQTEAVFVHPSSWRVDRPALRGHDVHDVLVGRLAEQGLRSS
ncbi:phage holin family protein [Aeromicrobium piscarium]|uniref:phage holin family protein n=1 Tax=Aeromicrobium piscarium TaxID=2590901 RepID=UPI00163D8E6D|nr:phage holin family protein [Aeromicrobium piscarium]